MIEAMDVNTWVARTIFFADEEPCSHQGWWGENDGKPQGNYWYFSIVSISCQDRLERQLDGSAAHGKLIA